MLEFLKILSNKNLPSAVFNFNCSRNNKACFFYTDSFCDIIPLNLDIDLAKKIFYRHYFYYQGNFPTYFECRFRMCHCLSLGFSVHCQTHMFVLFTILYCALPQCGDVCLLVCLVYTVKLICSYCSQYCIVHCAV